MKPFHVYILGCADGTYYTGHTDDIESRMSQHQDGSGGYTATRKPVKLLWQGEFETREGALAFEQQVKGWSRAKKEALMAGDWQRVQLLARSSERLRQAQPERLVESAVTASPAHCLKMQVQPEQLGEADGADRVDQFSSLANPPQLVPIQSVPPELVPPRSVPPELVEGRPEAQTWSMARNSSDLNLKDSIVESNAITQRRAIAKAITLLESTRADHRAEADRLLTALLPHTGNAFRLGISGVPGVGKSTFIEVLGLYLIDQGHRVAVLTIDPSSSVSGGSILGDKTRMEKLSVHQRAYIRPSPASGTLGGVAEKTREAMLVCEAAGYDIVIVETVGVGQSETAVAGMTDMFVLMQLPNAGDDLQAIKKGVMELADLVVINKADIDADAAMRAQAQITSAMRLFGLVNNAMGPAQAAAYDQIWHPRVVQLSALHNSGVDAFWAAVTQFRALQTDNGKLAARRRHQSLAWMWERIEAGLRQSFRHDPAVGTLLPRMVADVESGMLPASTAARNLLSAHAGRA